MLVLVELSVRLLLILDQFHLGKLRKGLSKTELCVCFALCCKFFIVPAGFALLLLLLSFFVGLLLLVGCFGLLCHLFFCVCVLFQFIFPFCPFFSLIFCKKTHTNPYISFLPCTIIVPSISRYITH